MTLHVETRSASLWWGSAGFALQLQLDAERPVAVTGVRVGDREHATYALPAIEILSASGGHVPASARLAHTELGTELLYTRHELRDHEGRQQLVVTVSRPGLEADWHLETVDGAPAIRSWIVVRNTGESPVVLRAVPSWTAGFTLDGAPDAIDGWTVLRADSDWLGESRWSGVVLRDVLPRIEQEYTGHNPRGGYSTSSTGTWSTGRHHPNGYLERDDLAWGWQIEHNGSWRSEIGEDTEGGYLSLSGPTDVDAAWVRELAPGETFETVPATVTAAADLISASANLTAYRRAARRAHIDNRAMPVVFNDYMNTLNGDPTTERLLPLIAAAAQVGAQIFCIDAGWYDDSGFWWDSVGEWQPSTTRFPGGLAEVIDAIRDAGMTPGLWLEPEVVGLRSPVADTLPDDAFLQRRGQRLVEHQRYHLDLRHPAAIAHLDSVVDRLVAEFGIGFFKFDYNIDPGAGTDRDAHSVGDGLLQHNRAHLAWLDGLLDRHPELVIENCGSGAMRSDFAMLSRLAMQSTSDQQDFRRFPPIAASAPLSMLPEQAANWAYPQPGMSPEEISFCLVTGLLGRFYLSGYLNTMTDAERALVAEAVRAYNTVRHEVATGTPSWPLGLPGWEDPWTALAIDNPGATLLSTWRRDAQEPELRIPLPAFAGRDLRVTTVFPLELPGWSTSWDSAEGVLTVHAGIDRYSARTLRLEPIDVESA